MDRKLFDYLDHLETLHTSDDAARALNTFLQNRGGCGGNIWFAIGTEEDDIEWANSNYSGYPKSYIEFMYEIADNWETAKKVSRSTLPVFWGWDLDKGRYERHSNEFAAAEFAHAEFGLRNWNVTWKFAIPSVRE